MLNTVLGLPFIAVAVAALVWRTFGDARDGAVGSDYGGKAPIETTMGVVVICMDSRLSVGR